MVARLAVALLSVAIASAFTVHQHSKEQECIDLQCPATAFDYGIKHLVNDDTMRSDQCTSCEQCTANGYSLCLRMAGTRASRSSSGPCSCAHSTPANCHNQLAKDDHPANITMKLYNICYMSALQAPPRPLAVNEKASVIVTVEPFWLEPYWRELTVENVTLHYDFTVKVPEHCEGDVITSETERAEHMCMNSLKINIEDSEEAIDGDYGQNELYDMYDDDLPPEVQFDRDVFAGAKLLKTYYTVDVRRPRQIQAKSKADPFRDLTTKLESEILKFDLKPEIFGTGIPELPPVDEKSMDSATETVADDEDESAEVGTGTNFFEPETKDTKSEEELEKEEDFLAHKIFDDLKTTTDTDDENKEESVKEEEAAEKETTEENTEASEHDEETSTTEEVEETTEGGVDDEEKENSLEETEKDEETDNEKKEENKMETEDEKETDEEKGEEEGAKSAENDELEGESEHEEESAENKSEETEVDAENHEEAEASGNDMEEEDQSFLSSILRDQYHLARWVFGITIAACMLIILCTCLYRRGLCCCKTSESKTTNNGYRYNNPNRGTELRPLTSATNEVHFPLDESAFDLETEQKLYRDIVRAANPLNPAKVEIGSAVGVGRFGTLHSSLFNAFNGAAHETTVYAVRDPTSLPIVEFHSLISLLKDSVTTGGHPNILTLRAATHELNGLLLLWDSIDSPSLQGILRESRCARFSSNCSTKSASFLSPERLFSIMIGCCNGVSHLIRKSIIDVHLCAANVLVAERGIVKIAGFGLAQAIPLSRDSKPSVNKTRWRAPEYYRNDELVGRESLIWSLGVLIWEILSLGGTPFSQIRSSDEMVDSLRDGTAELQNVKYGGHALNDLISLCTAHNVADRPNATTVIRRLECIAVDAPNHIKLEVEEEFPYLPISTQLEH